MRHPTYHEAHREFIVKFGPEMMVKEICQALGLTKTVVRNCGMNHGITFKKEVHPKTLQSQKLRPVLVKKQEEVHILLKRPPAEYDQIKSPYGISSEMRKL